MDEDTPARTWRRRALGARGDEMLVLRDGAVGALNELRDTHQRLWDLEDRARSRIADDHEIAGIKRDIDGANAIRHRQIDALDDLLVPCDTGAETGRLYSQTPGEICDRLLILELKACQLRALAGNPDLPGQERAQCEARLSLQERWHDHLQECLVGQLAEHGDRHPRFPPRAEIKLYNDRLLNPVTRREGGR